MTTKIQKQKIFTEEFHKIILSANDDKRIETYAYGTTISNQPYIDKSYLYVKDPFEAKYQFLINKRKNTGLNHLNDSKAFTEYSNDMDDICKNI